ncbi:MAG: SLC13 family permease, partial [Deltaproteobacteria bacterium]
VRLLSARLNEGVVAALAAALLFVLPVSFKKGEYTISWERAARIDWATILLFGGGLSLGELMFSTGLAEYLGSHLIGWTGAERLWTITAVGIVFSIILSETTSNTASANMAIPVMVAVAVGAGVSPIPPALGACLGASFGFMLPVSTPPNAIVYGSGLVPILSMVKKGIIFDIGGFVIIMLGLMILAPLMGWA